MPEIPDRGITSVDSADANAVSEATAEPARRSLVARSLSSQHSVLLTVIVLLGAVTEIRNGLFLSTGNLIVLFRSGVVYFVAACPVSLLLIGGGLDLSIGATFAASAVTAAWLMHAGSPWPVAVVLGVALGALIGSGNAIVVLLVKVPPFVATLGMMFVVGGLVNVATQGSTLSSFPNSFYTFGQGSLFSIPYLVYYAAAVGVLCHVLLRHTRFGYNSQAVGGNRMAALQSGILVNRTTLALYVLAGAGAGLAGILQFARLSVADPGQGGTGFTFQVLAAVIIGGTSLFGGVGTITGTLLGTLLFAVINNSLVLLKVDPLWQDVVTGMILVVAVALDQALRRRQFARGRSG